MGKHLHLAARQKRVWMFCAACIVVNVNVALHLDLCEKKLSGMEMEKWRLVVLPPSVGDLINHLFDK